MVDKRLNVAVVFRRIQNNVPDRHALHNGHTLLHGLLLKNALLLFVLLNGLSDRRKSAVKSVVRSAVCPCSSFPLQTVVETSRAFGRISAVEIIAASVVSVVATVESASAAPVISEKISHRYLFSPFAEYRPAETHDIRAVFDGYAIIVAHPRGQKPDVGIYEFCPFKCII